MTGSLLMILVAALLIGSALTIVCCGLFTDRSKEQDSDCNRECGSCPVRDSCVMQEPCKEHHSDHPVP